MMIKNIWFREYGPFRRAEFSLSSLTVLVGPNASGKTTAMESPLRIKRVMGPPRRIKRGGSSRPRLRKRPNNEFFQAFGRRAATELPFIAFDLDSSISYFSDIDAQEFPIANARHIKRDTLPTIRLLKFEPESLRAASYLDANELAIQQNGYGLATVLADMKLQDDERLGWIEKQVSAVIPNFERVRLKRAQVHRSTEPVAGHELIFDMKDAPGLSPDVVSDGTILVLGIVTSIAAAGQGQQDESVLILIDDLERGLHPRALNDFIGFLRRMTEEMQVQIIATSHSPYLLDALRPEEVRLTGFLEDGSATICELSDHPDFERWKDVMTPGEFWSTAGEDWVRDVRK